MHFARVFETQAHAGPAQGSDPALADRGGVPQVHRQPETGSGQGFQAAGVHLEYVLAAVGKNIELPLFLHHGQQAAKPMGPEILALIHHQGVKLLPLGQPLKKGQAGLGQGLFKVLVAVGLGGFEPGQPLQQTVKVARLTGRPGSY